MQRYSLTIGISRVKKDNGRVSGVNAGCPLPVVAYF